MDNTISHDEAQMPANHGSKRGGWIAFLFITGTLSCLTLAAGGWLTNLVVYLIEKYHVKSINATKTVNILIGCSSLLPVLAAIIADSLLGSFSVIWISSLVSLLGIVLLALTAMIDYLRPLPCEIGSSLCQTPTKIQFAVLYTGVALAVIGLGGTRFTIAAIGANQFDNVKDQRIFFNWFVVILYISSVLGATVIVFIEDNISWALGFGLCVVASMIGLALFLLGSHCYCCVKPQGSPFTSLARVVIAAIRKRKLPLSSKSEDYYYGCNGAEEMVSAPTKNFRFLNHAAQKTEGDTPWRLCSVQQVEDLKTLLRIFPVLSSGIFLSITIVVQGSFGILQALTMDRSLGQHFKIPAGSVGVIGLVSTAISVAFIDRLLNPLFQKFPHRSPTPLQRIGAGHVANIVGMAVSALIESQRLKLAQSHNLLDHPGSIVPMSVLWLLPQLAAVGFGEAFHYPGQVTLYYQEFPKSLASTATAMLAMIMGTASYLGNAVIDLVQSVTTWLPDDINKGRLDNLFWMLAVVGVLNFGYFLFCAWFYKYQNLEKRTDSSTQLIG